MAAPAPHCKIGKITLKGGAQLRVFEGSKSDNSRRMVDSLRSDIDFIVPQIEGDCGGYAFVIWKHDGTSYQEWNVSSFSKVTASLLPEFFAESFRRKTAKNDARMIIDQRLGR